MLSIFLLLYEEIKLLYEEMSSSSNNGLGEDDKRFQGNRGVGLAKSTCKLNKKTYATFSMDFEDNAEWMLRSNHREIVYPLGIHGAVRVTVEMKQFINEKYTLHK